MNSTGTRVDACRYVLKNNDLIRKLEQEKFDIVLSNPALIGGEILAAKLGIPHISTTNGYPADGHFRWAGVSENLEEEGCMSI